MIRSLLVRYSSSSRRRGFLSIDLKKASFHPPPFVENDGVVSDVGEATSPSSLERRRSYHSTSCHRYSQSSHIRNVTKEQPREQEVVEEETKEIRTGPNTGSRRRPKHQEIAYDFLEKVNTKQIPSAVVCQKVQEILLQVLLEEKHSIVPSDAPLALQLLNLSIANANQRGEKILPRLFNLSIQIMVHSRHQLAITEIQKQLFRLFSYREDSDQGYYFTNVDVVYNSHHVNDAFYQLISLVCGDEVTARANKTKSKIINYKTKQNIQAIMNRLEELYDNPNVALQRSSNGCDAFVRYYCIIEQNPTKAYQYLKEMMKSSSIDDQPPLVSTFTNSIAAYAKIGNPEKALEIIEWMLSSLGNKESHSTMPAPNWTCFNALLDAYARSGRLDSGNKAEQTLKWMRSLHRDPDKALETEPDEVSYATTINAWARCSATNPEAPHHAEQLLKNLIELYYSGREIQITEYAFTSVMNAWASSNIHTDNAPVKIRELIHLMHEIEGGEKSSTSSIDSSDKTNNDQKKMLEVTAIPYSILIKSWEKRAKNTKNPTIKNQCGVEALQVLEEMKAAGIDPLPGTYNSIITTLQCVSFSNALLYFLELEEEFQEQLQQQHPTSKNGSKMMLDTRTFNCGLNVIATMNKPDASERAFDILNRMNGYSKCTNLYPDETTYNIILKILSKDYHNDPNDSAMKAQKLLEEMANGGDKNNKIHRSIRPSHWSYLPTLMAWGRSTSSDKFHRIQNLLKNYEDQSHYSTYQQRQPMMISIYNAALSCCYHNDDPKLVNEAVTTAIFTVNRMRYMKQKTGLQPVYLTYLNFFRAMAIGKELSREDSNKLVEIDSNTIDQEFQNCISDGLVSKEIIELLHRIAPMVFHNYFGGDSDESRDFVDIATIEIPRAWKKNYNKKHRQQQQQPGRSQHRYHATS